MCEWKIGRYARAISLLAYTAPETAETNPLCWYGFFAIDWLFLHFMLDSE